MGGQSEGGMLQPEQQPSRLERTRLSTGDQAFDRVLGGGIPRDSLYIIAGPPGAGKTVLAQQISFAAARAGTRVIYFTNVSEPHSKLVEHISNFGFYVSDLIGDRIQIYNITSQVRNRGFKETLDFIVDTVRGEKAGLVIIDSFRGLKHVLEVGVRDRGAIFDLAAQLSILGCTSLIVGEYTGEESQTDPEFAVADGIIQLHHTTMGTQDRRWLRVAKMRGVGYLSGEHTFAITERGVQAYPRLEALVQAPPYSATTERATTGIATLDDMLSGGVIRSSSTLLAGSAGSGKTLLALHFLAAGAAQGERGLMVSFQENPEQLRIRASQFGIGEQLRLDDGMTEVLSLSPVELDLDIAAARIREAVETHAVRRVVIDSVAELEFATREQERFDDFMASLIGYLRGNEITTMMTREITQIFGSELSISSRGLSFVVDNIILLRYLEVQARIRRAITVLKSRGSSHNSELRDLLIAPGEVRIGDRLDGLTGILSGLPRSIENGAQAAPSTAQEGRL